MLYTFALILIIGLAARIDCRLPDVCFIPHFADRRHCFNFGAIDSGEENFDATKKINHKP